MDKKFSEQAEKKRETFHKNNLELFSHPERERKSEVVKTESLRERARESVRERKRE